MLRGMPNYLRPRIPGATVFFTLCLAERSATALTDQIEALRLSVAQTRAERPFTIEAFVVLPDHLHAIWTLPEGDADYSVRWGAIKARFSMAARRAGFTPPPRHRLGSNRTMLAAMLLKDRIFVVG